MSTIKAVFTRFRLIKKEAFSKWRMRERTGASVACRHVVEPDSCSILTFADSSRRAVSFRKDTSEMRALRDDVHAEQLAAYRQVSGCKGKNI